MIDYIFVYGTLMRKHAVFRWFDTEYICEASIKGFDIFNLGWYPGIRHSTEDSAMVHGELHRLPLDGASEVLRALDQYEGEGQLYIREVVDVEIDSGVYVKAWVYVYNHEPTTDPIPTRMWPAARGAGGHAVAHR